MRLYFFRHGIAEDADLTSVSDFSRILTPKGEQRTKAAASALQTMGLKITRLYSSPLTRAQQTAELLSAALDVPVIVRDEIGPGFSLEAVAELIQDFHDDDAIMFVGHEPDFSSTVRQCIGGGDIVIKKGSLARVDVISREPLRGALAWLIPAKAFLQNES